METNVTVTNALPNLTARLLSVDPELAARYTIPTIPKPGADPAPSAENQLGDTIIRESYDFGPKELQDDLFKAELVFVRRRGDFHTLDLFYDLELRYHHFDSERSGTGFEHHERHENRRWTERYPVVDGICVVAGEPKSDHPLYRHIRQAVAGPV